MFDLSHRTFGGQPIDSCEDRSLLRSRRMGLKPQRTVLCANFFVSTSPHESPHGNKASVTPPACRTELGVHRLYLFAFGFYVRVLRLELFCCEGRLSYAHAEVRVPLYFVRRRPAFVRRNVPPSLLLLLFQISWGTLARKNVVISGQRAKNGWRGRHKHWRGLKILHLAPLNVFAAVCRYVEFNPVAENIVMTTNADHSVQLCDVAAGGGTAACTIDVHTNSINR